MPHTSHTQTKGWQLRRITLLYYRPCVYKGANLQNRALGSGTQDLAWVRQGKHTNSDSHSLLRIWCFLGNCLIQCPLPWSKRSMTITRFCLWESQLSHLLKFRSRNTVYVGICVFFPPFPFHGKQVSKPQLILIFCIVTYWNFGEQCRVTTCGPQNLK